MYFKLQNSLKKLLLIPAIPMSLLFSDNNSLSFDGVDDYVDFADIYNSLELPVTFQIQTKFNSSGGDIFVTDSDLNESQDNYFGFYLGVFSNKISIMYGDGNGTGGGHRRTGRTYVSLNPNTWYSITCIIRGPQDMSIYLDGVNQEMNYDDGGFGGSVGSNEYPFTLGGSNVGNNSSSYYDGKIDELRFWNIELTDPDVISFESFPEEEPQEGLIGYWSFNEGEGNTVNDYSGLGYHGAIYGATWSTDVPSTPTLFFSEYSEGSSNNKYLEIYNCTTDNLSLDDFVILGNYNGNDWSETFTFASGATIAAGEVYVLANENSDQSVITEADETFAYGDPWYITSFNGDDVRALALASDPLNNIIDIIGTLDWDGDGNPGEGGEDDPGSGFMVAGVQDATANHTLVRKNSVTVGNNGDWTGSAGTTLEDSEWVVLDENDWSAIGWHINDPSVIQSFDDLPEDYWTFESNSNADPTYSYFNTSYENFENRDAMRVEYGVHNAEEWGGFVSIREEAPNSSWDWSDYNTISLDYFNSITPDQTGRVELRLILNDENDNGFYSFHYVLDDLSSGWNTIDIPLLNNGSWIGYGFNLTGWWPSDNGDGVLNLSAITSYSIEFSMNGQGQGDYVSGTTYFDNLRLSNTTHVFPVTFKLDTRNLNVSPNGIHLAGNFNDFNNDDNIDNAEYPQWDPAGIMLQDVNGNGVFEVTLSLVTGDYQYKFINGNSWEDQHDQFHEELSCTYNDGSGFYNRRVAVDADVNIAPVCLNSCDPCEINHSLSFDGDDDYVATGIEYLDLLGASEVSISVSMKWLASDSDGGTSSQGLISNGSSIDGHQIELSIDSDNSQKLSLWWSDNSTAGSPNMQSSFLDFSLINYDQWYNIKVVLNDNTAKWYMDDQLVETDDVLFTTLGYYQENGVPALHIGQANRVYDTFFNGLIDEVQISINGSETNLAHWNFNQGEGTTLTDLSGNENNGTINGATWSTDVPQNTTTNPPLDLTWSVQVSAQQGTLSDIDNYLGTADGATNEFDASADELEPPLSPGDNLQIYFPHPEWDNFLGDYFSSDIRPEVDLLDTMQVWDMVVTSNVAGDVSLSFTFDDVPEVPVILERVSSGVRTNLSSGDTYSVTLEAEEEVLLRVSVGDNTPPSLAIDSFPDGPAVYLTGSTRNLTWTADDGFEYDSAFVHLSLDSGQTYTPLEGFGAVTSYQWTVPDLEDDITYGGMLRVEGRDYAGNTALIVNNKPFVIVGDSLGTSINAGWTLWGSPVVPAVDSMHLSLGDDFDGYWSTFDYLNGGYTYDGFLYQNRGYWLASMEDTEVDVLGGVSDTAVTMSLSPGWMLITNPLVLDVAVDSLLFNDDSQTLEYADAVNAGWVNVIYGHDASGYQTADVLKPWHGYWLAVLSDRIHLTFPIHNTPAEEVRENREDYWAINFSASGENVTDDMLVIGYHEQATDGFDMEYDHFTPPASPGNNQLQLSVAHPEWNLMLGDHFSSDIRSAIPNGSFKEWVVNLNTNLESITLEAQLLNVPEDLEVGYSTNGGIYFGDLREAGTLSLQTNENVIIRVGSQVLSLDEARIPVDYALNQNYPNPFNPTTMITYGLPKDGMVQISIYDVMGREVRNLVSGFKDAGYHSVTWDARNISGESVAAGMYIYTIQAGEFRSTKKMVLLK